MTVNPLYETVELLRDDGIRTYSAREVATGRDVLLHVFSGTHAQKVDELLAQIQTLKDRRIPELLSNSWSRCPNQAWSACASGCSASLRDTASRCPPERSIA